MGSILVDSVYMEAYKRILKRVIHSVWTSPVANDIYARLTYTQTKVLAEHMQDFTGETCGRILKCLETQMKAQSLLTKYQLPLECAPNEAKAFQSIIEALVETGKYKTSCRGEYELAYYPILRGAKLSNLGYPSEREFVICYKEEKGVVSIPNRIYLKVKSDLLQVSTSISNSDIR